MNNKALVSVIVPTKNEEKNIATCLKSIKLQSYKNIEIIVVDNNSGDKTKDIAKKYTKNVFDKGPERSAQRNFGAQKSKGKYLLFIDADMKISKDVVKECVELFSKNSIGGVIIPEESYGHNFWARCKELERSFYLGVDWIESARFFRKDVFDQLKGYSEEMISGEDWDIQNRLVSTFNVERSKSFIYHNEGSLSILGTMKKKFYYAQHHSKYRNKSLKKTYDIQSSILARYKLYFSDPAKLFKNPLLGIGMLFLKMCEFISGGVGFIYGKYITR